MLRQEIMQVTKPMRLGHFKDTDTTTGCGGSIALCLVYIKYKMSIISWELVVLTDGQMSP